MSDDKEKPKETAKAKVVSGGKKKKKNKPTSVKYTKYTIDGDKVIRGKYCPRCGPGVFVMKAAGRNYCGRCHYTEFIKSA